VRWGSLVFVLGLVGCAPSTKLPSRPFELPRALVSTTTGPSAAAIGWRAFFADEVLTHLIDEGISNNLDLQIAVQRIETTRAGVYASTGLRIPQVAAFASSGVTRFARYTIDGSGAATTEIRPGRITPSPVLELTVGLQASWEVDLWGKLAGLQGAARSRYLSSIEGANLVITNLVAGIASSYYELVALDHQRDALLETIARQTQALEMIRAQKEAGRANELAVRQFEVHLESTRALEAANLQTLREAENRLCVLLGRFPGPVARQYAALEGAVASTLAVGLPSELVRYRPDIREAELQIEAARFDLEAARAAFYPSLTLTGTVALSAFDPRFLITRTPDSILASLVGGLLAPLINRRGIEAEFTMAKAAQLEALYRYQGVVLGAFAEVSSGLAALEQSARIVAHRKAQRAAVTDTIEASDALFRAGKASYLEVLLAQQNRLEAELELIAALRDQHLASVRLYRALGGGWMGTLQPVRPADR
jgi:multidrug efflux system outer membrane protein